MMPRSGGADEGLRRAFTLSSNDAEEPLLAADAPAHPPAPHAARVAFGPFEADLQTGELRRAGRRVPLQPKPFRVLAVLLREPGELVTRERLRLELWSDSTTVDFDQGLGFCVRQVRQALEDDARRPRYVETLPRRGLRFIAPVAPASSPGPAASSVEPLVSVPAAAAPSRDWRARAAGLLARLARRLRGAVRVALLCVPALLLVPPALRLPAEAREPVQRQGEAAARHAFVAAGVAPAALAQATGTRLKLVVQLVRVGDGAPLWTRSYALSERESDAELVRRASTELDGALTTLTHAPAVRRTEAPRATR